VMTKLRDDVRTAFERQQTGLGNVGDARDRLMQNALPQRDLPASRGLQLAAGVAAVLIAAIVIATFVIARAGSHNSLVPAATPSPKAQASPTPLGNTLNVPDSTPIIVYSDPAKAGQLDGITWDGKASGRLGNQNLVGVGNPQNNLFAGANFIADRAGQTVLTRSMGAKSFQGTWADDGTHFCQMVPFDNPGGTGIPTTLQLVTVGQNPQPKNIARVGTLANQTTVSVAACSPHSDRAVVVQSGGQGVFTVQYWVVQLSTGKVIWTHTFDVAQTSVQVIASRDGMYVAENLDQGVAASGSTVYGPDGKALVHLTAFVKAFSWDGNLAVVDMGYGSTQVNLISWRYGTVFWTCPPSVGLLRAVPEPAGSEIAVWLIPSAQFQQVSQTPDLYVLSPSGMVVFHIARTGLALP